MSAAEAVEWMDDHKWGNEVDPLLRAAAGVTDKNQAKKAASLLNAMNTTEASAKRNFNDKNHNLNRLLETYKTSDGKHTLTIKNNCSKIMSSKFCISLWGDTIKHTSNNF